MESLAGLAAGLAVGGAAPKGSLTAASPSLAAGVGPIGTGEPNKSPAGAPAVGLLVAAGLLKRSSEVEGLAGARLAGVTGAPKGSAVVGAGALKGSAAGAVGSAAGAVGAAGAAKLNRSSPAAGVVGAGCELVDGSNGSTAGGVVLGASSLGASILGVPKKSSAAAGFGASGLAPAGPNRSLSEGAGLISVLGVPKISSALGTASV
jgi:hypothetical protein